MASSRWRGVILVLILLSGCRDSDWAAVQRVSIGGQIFSLDLALDDATRFQGFSNRSSIPADVGLLFVWPTATNRAMVMRRCLVPIDLIFLGPNGRIVSMHRMSVEPYETAEADLRRYESRWPVQFAIELRGGTIDQLDLEPGHQLDLPVKVLKQRAH